jgi:phage gp36-like protein
MQTYCTKTDLEALWPPDDLLDSVDDDTSGTLSATEEGHITRAIERAANLMDARLAVRYQLADLATNTWCRDANAAIAAFLLATRRGLAAPAQLTQQYEAYVLLLDRIAAGFLRVPEAAESFEPGPSVTNFAIDLSEPYRKAAVVEETSTPE